MTADNTTQTKPEGPSTVLHKLALVCAALTVFFACIALLLGSRQATLQANFLHSKEQAANSEAATIQQMQSNLKTAQQALDAEKKQNEQLRHQVSATEKDLKTVKADLAKAKELIGSLQVTPAGQSVPSSESPPSAPAAGIENVPPTGVMPQLAPKPVEMTKTTETQAPGPSANTAQPVATNPPPTNASGTSSGSSSIPKKTITEKND